MTVAQTNAVVALVQSVPALASKTFVLVAPRDSTGKLPVPPYAVVQPHDGTETQERVTGPRSTMHPRYVIHFVGSSYSNAQTVLEAVKPRFVVNGFGVKVAVAGETSKRLHWSSPMGVQVDNDETPPLIFATAEIMWDSEPTL
jgi:hypothetical protein